MNTLTLGMYFPYRVGKDTYIFKTTNLEEADPVTVGRYIYI